ELGVEPLALHDALLDFLASESARAPVLLLFDDLHACDLASLQLAGQLARPLAALRVAFIGSHRDAEARRAPEIESALARLGRAGEVLVLPRLDAEAVAQMMRDETGVDDPAAARLMHEATDGNPLFVRELMRFLRQRRAGGGVPAGVRSVIRERLALLSPAAVSLLQAAAVVGRDFLPAVAAEVAGVTAGAMAEALDE